VLRGRARATHPDLGRSVVGVTVPRWDEILDIAARCYDAVPLGYLGVDVVLDAADGPLVLELNARPGLTIQLANGRGLRAVMETVAATDVAGLTPQARVELGRALARDAPTGH
jgi:predicted ATP-grasp superfamily ATP-dependent carboligase